MLTRTRALRLSAAFIAAILFLSACGSDSDDSAESADTAESTTSVDESSDSSTTEGNTAEVTLAAADLRMTLNSLLQEHVFLAGAAVNEAFQGNTAGFEAAAAALDENSVALSEAVGLAYGEEAGSEFLDLWRSHIDLLVAYTTAVAAGDTAAAEEQAEFLVGYATDFANFLAGPTGIEADALEELVLEHILTLKAAVDSIAAGEGNPFILLREAGAHMAMIAQPLAVAIANA
jgi:hypothetical protein